MGHRLTPQVNLHSAKLTPWSFPGFAKSFTQLFPSVQLYVQGVISDLENLELNIEKLDQKQQNTVET